MLSMVRILVVFFLLLLFIVVIQASPQTISRSIENNLEDASHSSFGSIAGTQCDHSLWDHPLAGGSTSLPNSVYLRFLVPEVGKGRLITDAVLEFFYPVQSMGMPTNGSPQDPKPPVVSITIMTEADDSAYNQMCNPDPNIGCNQSLPPSPYPLFPPCQYIDLSGSGPSGGRKRTTNSVSWMLGSWLGVPYTDKVYSPQLKDIVQEAVDHNLFAGVLFVIIDDVPQQGSYSGSPHRIMLKDAIGTIDYAPVIKITHDTTVSTPLVMPGAPPVGPSSSGPHGPVWNVFKVLSSQDDAVENLTTNKCETSSPSLTLGIDTWGDDKLVALKMSGMGSVAPLRARLKIYKAYLEIGYDAQSSPPSEPYCTDPANHPTNCVMLPPPSPGPTCFPSPTNDCLPKPIHITVQGARPDPNQSMNEPLCNTMGGPLAIPNLSLMDKTDAKVVFPLQLKREALYDQYGSTGFMSGPVKYVYQSYDISDIIQEIVNAPSTNTYIDNLTLFLSADAPINFFSKESEGNCQCITKLRILYNDMDELPAPTQNMIPANLMFRESADIMGLQNMGPIAPSCTSSSASSIDMIGSGSEWGYVGIFFSLPPFQNGQKIESAYIEFTKNPGFTEQSGDAFFQIEVDVDQQMSMLNCNTMRPSYSLRKRSANKVLWTPGPWAPGPCCGSTTFKTPSLTRLLQEFVSNPMGPVYNDILFLITGSGVRTVDLSGVALHLSYHPLFNYAYTPGIPYYHLKSSFEDPVLLSMTTTGPLQCDYNNNPMLIFDANNFNIEIFEIMWPQPRLMNSAVFHETRLSFVSASNTTVANTLTIRIRNTQEYQMGCPPTYAMDPINTNNEISDISVTWELQRWVHGVRYYSPDLSILLNQYADYYSKVHPNVPSCSMCSQPQQSHRISLIVTSSIPGYAPTPVTPTPMGQLPTAIPGVRSAYKSSFMCPNTCGDTQDQNLLHPQLTFLYDDGSNMNPPPPPPPPTPILPLQPVNGDWCWYENTDICDKTCGGGNLYRRCACPPPSVVDDNMVMMGLNCAGLAAPVCNTQACPINTVPVDGGWTTYAACSISCGSGTQERLCTNPAPKDGGAYCVGANKRSCNTQACPVTTTNAPTPTTPTPNTGNNVGLTSSSADNNVFIFIAGSVLVILVGVVVVMKNISSHKVMNDIIRRQSMSMSERKTRIGSGQWSNGNTNQSQNQSQSAESNSNSNSSAQNAFRKASFSAKADQFGNIIQNDIEEF